MPVPNTKNESKDQLTDGNGIIWWYDLHLMQMVDQKSTFQFLYANVHVMDTSKTNE